MDYCKNCGCEIKKQNKRHVFCSHKCRMQTWRANHQKELVEKLTIKKVALTYQGKLAKATKDEYLELLLNFYEDVVNILLES